MLNLKSKSYSQMYKCQMNLIMLVKFVQFNHLLKVSLAAGLEEAGEMTKTAAKEKASIAQANLQEAVRILRVEPDMDSVLEDRMQLVKNVLAKLE